MKRDIKWQNRKFLSTNFHEGSTVSSQVEAWHHDTKSGVHHVDATLVIRDCDRTVRLDFDFWDKESQHQRLEKLRGLIQDLQGMYDAIDRVVMVEEGDGD